MKNNIEGTQKGNDDHHQGFEITWFYISSKMDYDRDTETYVEAMQSQGWEEAITSQVDSIKKNQTWEAVDLPRVKCTINTKWIFLKKKWMLQGKLKG